jgi:hypothetical protein
MPVDRQFTGYVVNLLGDIFPDANLLSTAVANLGFLRNVMSMILAGKVLRYQAPAVTFLSPLFDRVLSRRRINRPRRACHSSIKIEEVLLPWCFRQPLTTRAQPQALHRQVLFLEAVVGSLQIAVGRASLVELPLQVSELSLHLVELIENAA